MNRFVHAIGKKNLLRVHSQKLGGEPFNWLSLGITRHLFRVKLV
jgi:hypothetical protein